MRFFYSTIQIIRIYTYCRVVLRFNISRVHVMWNNMFMHFTETQIFQTPIIRLHIVLVFKKIYSLWRIYSVSTIMLYPYSSDPVDHCITIRKRYLVAIIVPTSPHVFHVRLYEIVYNVKTTFIFKFVTHIITSEDFHVASSVYFIFTL